MHVRNDLVMKGCFPFSAFPDLSHVFLLLLLVYIISHNPFHQKQWRVHELVAFIWGKHFSRQQNWFWEPTFKLNNLNDPGDRNWSLSDNSTTLDSYGHQLHTLNFKMDTHKPQCHLNGDFSHLFHVWTWAPLFQWRQTLILQHEIIYFLYFISVLPTLYQQFVCLFPISTWQIPHAHSCSIRK